MNSLFAVELETLFSTQASHHGLLARIFFASWHGRTTRSQQGDTREPACTPHEGQGSIYLSTVSIYLSIYLPIYPSTLSTYLPIYPSTLSTDLPIYRSTHLTYPGGQGEFFGLQMPPGRRSSFRRPLVRSLVPVIMYIYIYNTHYNVSLYIYIYILCVYVYTYIYIYIYIYICVCGRLGTGVGMGVGMGKGMCMCMPHAYTLLYILYHRIVLVCVCVSAMFIMVLRRMYIDPMTVVMKVGRQASTQA